MSKHGNPRGVDEDTIQRPRTCVSIAVPLHSASAHLIEVRANIARGRLRRR